ncbi:MAG: hypothetical protein R3F59_16075 [Myxococcota bacterium]
MRTLVTWTLVAAAAGAACKKAPPAAPEPEPAPVEAPAPAPEAEPEPDTSTTAVVPPAERPHNADFTASVVNVDGTGSKGQVVRVERTEDWYGEDGWTDDPDALKVTLEGNGTEVEVPWTDIARIDISYGGAQSDVDCSYDSSYDPAMYMCVNRTTTKVKTKDGKSWEGTDRHKWMFVFSNGDAPEFYVHKLPAREQEAETPALGTVTENTALYQKLQGVLETERKGAVPATITITAPAAP